MPHLYTWLSKRKWNIGYVFAILLFLNVGKKFSLIYLNSVLYILINKGKTLKKWVKHLQRARSSMLDKALAPRSSTLARKIPWTEESSRLQSTGSLRVVSLFLFPFMHWRRKWQPTPVFLPGESQGWRSLVAAICGVAQSRTRLKRLSSSSRSSMQATSLQSLT